MSETSTFRFLMMGTGQSFIACAELLLGRSHTIVGVVSDCPEVSAWSVRRGIARRPVAEQNRVAESGLGFDYLLSIVNHAIVAPELLAAPTRGAINYHDSLLPAYAGFNATSWSILEGQRTHGVTWHLMSAEADRGPVLIQQTLDIGDDDTAFSLGVRCSEAGVATFATLVSQIESGTLKPREQQGQWSFHLRSERLGLALLDPSRPATDLHALVRALTFGPEDNWMSSPKLVLPDGFVSVLETRVDPATDAAPGTIVSVGPQGLAIATSNGLLVVTELATLEGEALEIPSVAARFGLREGQRLPAPDAALVESGAAFDAVVTKSERFWMRRLAALRAATLPGLTSNAATGRVATLERALPAELASATAAHRASVLAAALGAFVHRLGGGDAFDFALHATVPNALRPLYASATPLRFAMGASTTFGALVAEAAGELAESQKRGTFARDIRARYGALRGRAALALPIGLNPTSGDGSATLVEGSALTLSIGSGANCAWSYDSAAISPEALRSLVERFEVLLAAGLADGESRLASLPLLPAAERALLLTTWQQTDRPHDTNTCVHQLIAQQVERTPDAIAVAFGQDELTYRELDRRANAVAHALRAVGVGPEVLVGLFAERSIDMIVSLLGIMKAGGAYVPMDPAYPRDRLAIMLEDSKARVVVTQGHLAERLPSSGAELVLVDRIAPSGARDETAPDSGVRGEHLAYVIFTSGSTGRPKGTMLEHRNVTNFFVGMDEALGKGATPGVWLAVTSISFDISVLELFWTLARGFKVVIAPESDRATLEQRERQARPAKPMGFGLFYFSADSGSATPGKAYRLLLEGAKYADQNGFDAVWTPERHFHAFGGLYPNPSVTTAALSSITERVHLRAGSIVLPLHDPLRVAEEWAVIDQLSNGRVGLSVASGWHVNDFAFKPDNYERRREVMLEHIETVLKLWRGEKVSVKNGAGEMIEVAVLPRPVQASPPLWIASAGSVDTFILAGRLGANVLTNMLGQDLADLKNKFAAYRKARREAGFEGDGIISVMLHTFVCGDSEEARRLARKPFSNYLASSFDLVKVAPKMFPAFRQPSREAAASATIDSASFSPEDMEALLEHAFDRYFETAGLFGTPERAMEMVDRLAEIGANDMACLVDFGIDPEVVLASLPHLKRLKDLCAARAAAPVAVAGEALEGLGALMQRHGVTHFQCTPSMARVLANDPESLAGLAKLERLMLGGEALPTDLATQLAGVVAGKLLNMYGPTETTVWSTTALVDRKGAPTIGRPIANTTIRVLDEQRQLVPIGTPGELYIGGAGVARGYLDRLELTAQRFVADPITPGARLYRTGDLVRYRADGELEFLGRLDHQVKISGHRIELGEIETALTRHPSVHHGVVVARTMAVNGAANGAAPALVAYVVPSNRGKSGANDADRVRSWETLWDETYKAAAGGDGAADPRFVIAGWNDSYSGEPIPPAEMREWLDTTVDRIRALKPRRVLEIGCGTGMILYRVAPHVEHYTGVDISQQALRSIAQELTPAESAKVTLLQQPAHALEQVAEKSCDVVVINSVAQYFPDAEYLVRVLRRATELVADGGSIFVGDVRSFAHLGAFHGSIELQQASSETAWPELKERIERRVARDSELVLSEAFFHALVRETPRLQGVEVELKRGRARNELTAFRYDVVLRVGPKSPTARPTGITPALGVASLDDVRAKLATSPAVLYLADVPNARLTSLAAAFDTWPKESPAEATAGRLRERLAATPDQGIDPEALYSLRDDYEVQIRWAHSGDPARFDAVLRHRARGARAAWPWDAPAHAAAPATYANTPIGASDDATLTSQLREHLRRGLPEYMVPTTFVVLDALPLTPNGKIDRNALPAPEPARLAVAAASFVPPTNDLEQRIASVWQELLGIDRVGRQDNIFDLGANSLLTMQANNRLSSVLGRKVSLVSMFRYPTVASLAAHLGDGSTAAAAVDTKAQERASRAEQAAERRRALRAERTER